MSDPSPDPNLQYYTWLGWFLNRYAKIETFMKRFLRLQTGLTGDQFQALMGNPRISDLISKLRKLLGTNMVEVDRDQVYSALAQLDEVGKLRQNVVHNGGHALDDGTFLIRLPQHLASRTTDRAHEIYTSNELWAAQSDLETIERILLGNLEPRLPDDWKVNYREAVARYGPWRYKHTQPK